MNEYNKSHAHNEHSPLVQELDGENDPQFLRYLEARAEEGLLLRQSSFGGITAVAAFMYKDLAGKSVSPAFFDEVIGRMPDQPGNPQKLTTYFLEQGLRGEAYTNHPMYGHIDRWMAGAISLDELIAEYKQFHDVDEEYEQNILRPYYEETVAPSYTYEKEMIDPYLGSGQFSKHPDTPITAELIGDAVDRGCYVLVPLGDKELMCIFRPVDGCPAVSFSASDHGSLLAPVTQKILDLVIANSSQIVAWSNPS